MSRRNTYTSRAQKGPSALTDRAVTHTPRFDGAGSDAPAFAEPSACPLCDGAPTTQTCLFVKQQATFVRCDGCGFVFINPRPTTAWLADRYNYIGEEYFTEPSKVASDFRLSRHDQELAIIA